MEITKRKAWRNDKCNDCGNPVYSEEGDIYDCEPDFITSFRRWKFCKKCVYKNFSEEIVKKIK